MPDREPDARRAARIAVAAVFFTNGVLFSTVVPRYPDIKADLGLSNASLGTALAAFPFGALLAGLFSASLIRRFRSARVASFGLVALAAMIVTIAAASSWAALAAVLFVAGALDAVIDVAQNAHGLRVQRAYGRSIVNSFHGVWSIGAVTGGLIGAAAAGLDVPLGAQLAVVAAVFSVVAAVAYRFLLPGPDEARSTVAPERAGRRPWPAAAVRALAALGLVAACGALVEDAGASWSALYLRTEIGATAAVAGLGFVALQSAMTVGRLLGDRVVDRFGPDRVTRAGGVLVAAGLGGALAVQSTGTTLLGFAVAGLGVATVIPAAMHAADELPGLPVGVGLMVVSWLLRVGFLVSPPLVGAIADATSLRVGLLCAVGAGLVMVVFSPVLGHDRR